MLDDFSSEAKEISKAGNDWFAYSPALHALRESGTLVGLLDLLDERALRPGEAATLAGLLLGAEQAKLSLKLTLRLKRKLRRRRRRRRRLRLKLKLGLLLLALMSAASRLEARVDSLHRCGA